MVVLRLTTSAARCRDRARIAFTIAGGPVAPVPLIASRVCDPLLVACVTASFARSLTGTAATFAHDCLLACR